MLKENNPRIIIFEYKRLKEEFRWVTALFQVLMRT